MNWLDSLCLQYDQYLKDQDKTVWIVQMEGGCCGGWIEGDRLTVYQDDNRPGLEPKAWIRLKGYFQQKNNMNVSLDETLQNWVTYRIKKIGLMFRDHIEYLPQEYPKGIYFSWGVGGNMLSPHTENYYVLGVVEGDKVHKYWYRVPELILYDETWDQLDPLLESNDPRLIMA